MTSAPSFLFAGLVVGVSIAAPIGPMALLCIQRTLACGMRTGVSTGLGAATVNVLYGALILVGLRRAAPLLASAGHLLSFASGLFLLWSAARLAMRRSAAGTPAGSAVLSPWGAFGTAAAFNATNPMSAVLIVALLSPVVGVSAPAPGDAAVLLVGMFAAAAAWWVCLTAGVALLRTRLSPRMLGVANQVAAAVLTVYGALALARAGGM